MKKTIKNAVACLCALAFVVLLMGIAGALVANCAFPWGAAVLCGICGAVNRLLW